MPPNYLLSILTLLSTISPDAAPDPDPPNHSPNTQSINLPNTASDLENSTLDNLETPQQRKSRLQRERRERQRLLIRASTSHVQNAHSASTSNSTNETTQESSSNDRTETERERATRLQRERRQRSRQSSELPTKRQRDISRENTPQPSESVSQGTNANDEETKRERANRLQRERRSRENEEQRTRRLSADSLRKSATRQRESEQERAQRLAAKSQQTAAAREMESEQERAQRLAANSQQTAAAREMESEQERAQRLAANSQQTAAAREMESDQQLLQRLEQDAQRTAAARALLTDSQVLDRRMQERMRHRLRNAVTPDEPAAYSSTLVTENYLGLMNSSCVSCGAKYFSGECNFRQEKANICCNFGSVQMDHFADYPDILKNLFVGATPSCSNFRNHIRNFNSALAMASMGAQVTAPPGVGPYCYKVHGQVYHFIGALQPENGVAPQYGQLYILDTQMAADERMGRSINSKCEPALMKSLSELIAEINVYAQSFKMMHRVALEEEKRAAALQIPRPTLRMIFDVDKTLDRRRYNIPESNEVAAVFVGEENDVPPNRSIALHLTGGGLQKIRDIDKLCDPLTYPLFFPTGASGWHPELTKAPNDPTRKRNRVSQREYYSYLLSIRDRFNPILYGGKLLQQFVVDSWIKIEQNRLNYVRTHQSELRSDAYQSLIDHVNTGIDTTVPGARIVLPSSFSGSPRNMQQGFQDGMAIVTKYGKPTYFLTITCNPKWKEILENLLPGQTASDRPDLIARVFNLKLKELFDDLLNKHVLGKVAAYISVVEWQKRGLPHCHILLTMTAECKPTTAEHGECHL